MKRCKAHHLLCLLVTALAISGCSKGKSSSTVASVSGSLSGTTPSNYTCSFTEIDVFPVSSDPTQNFSVSNVAESSFIQNNTCNGIYNGESTTQTVASMSSSSGQITMVNPNDSISISGTQATVPAADLQQCSSGIQATGILSQVVLDSFDDDVRVVSTWSLVNNGCTQNPSASGQSNAAQVVVNTFSVPANLTSSSYYLYLQTDPGASGDAVQEWSYTDADSVFQVFPNLDSAVGISVTSNDRSTAWDVGFGVPGSNQLGTGSYSNVIDSSQASEQALPALNLSGYIEGLMNPFPDYKGTGGNFQILAVSYDGLGNLTKFSATFTLIVNQAAGSIIRGVINYDSADALAVFQPPADTTSPDYFYLYGSALAPSGSSISVNQTQGELGAIGTNAAGGAVTFVYTDSLENRWQVVFTFPGGVIPQVGSYGGQPGAITPTSGNQQAMLSVTSMPSGNNTMSPEYQCDEMDPSIRFNVTNIQFDGAGTVASFAADFEENCELYSNSVYGAVRYNVP
jgi:hypothetical protein